MSLSQPVDPSLHENKSCIFYKLLSASVLQDKKLKIPNKFVKKFRDELAPIATVSVPGGRRWLVELREDNKRIWLDSGWNAFVEYHSICIGHFLIFEYEGNSHFDVRVYNLKTSEMNYREFGCDPLSKDVKNDECMDHDGKKHKNSTCMHRESDLPELRATFRSTRDKGIQFSGVEVTSTGDEGDPCFVRTKTIKQEAESNEHDSLLKFKAKEELPSSNSTSVTKEEKQDVFKPENHFFVPVAEIPILKKPGRKKQKFDHNEHDSLLKFKAKEELPSSNSMSVTKEEKQNVFHAYSMFKPDCFVRVTEIPILKKPGKKKQKFDHNEQDSSAGHGEDDDAQIRAKYYENASARKRTVTAEEREKAIIAARSFVSTNPFFRVILRPSYLYRGCIMYLPCGFAEKYLSTVSENVKLQRDGRQWPVRCIYKEGKAKFHQGWYEFASDNNLGEGDVCIFELLGSTEFVLEVTVFRVTENVGSMHRS